MLIQLRFCYAVTHSYAVTQSYNGFGPACIWLGGCEGFARGTNLPHAEHCLLCPIVVSTLMPKATLAFINML